jgi:hypothetical protein
VEESKQYGTHKRHLCEGSYCDTVVSNIVQSCTDVLEINNKDSFRMCLQKFQNTPSKHTLS